MINLIGCYNKSSNLSLHATNRRVNKVKNAFETTQLSSFDRPLLILIKDIKVKSDTKVICLANCLYLINSRNLHATSL